MSRQVSPFAALSGAEKQIKWLEYQSIRLPYVSAETEAVQKENSEAASAPQKPPAHAEPPTAPLQPPRFERPLPPPEIPRTMPDLQKTRHSQYDAVIARMKQAELQARRCPPLS